jgi:hypothetical protein
MPNLPISTIRARFQNRMVDRPCPWCDGCAWNRGTVIATPMADDNGDIRFTRGLARLAYVAIVFTCGICGYALSFSIGYYTIDSLPPRRTQA